VCDSVSQHHEADPSAVDHEVLRVGRVEGLGKALARTLLVITTQPLQARTHGAQAQRQQGLEVAGRRGGQRDALRGRRQGHARAFLICSSTSLALAGIGVPGP
jgi:hypothetical protein